MMGDLIDSLRQASVGTTQLRHFKARAEQPPSYIVFDAAGTAALEALFGIAFTAARR